MWQPAEGGDAISAAEAGYGTIAGGEVLVGSGVLEGSGSPKPEVAPETGDLPDGTGDLADEEPAAPAAEDAAMHVDASVADEAGDEIAADSDIDGESAETAAEAEAEIELKPGDES